MEPIQLILATIGTVLAVLFIVQARKGEKYEEMLAPLDEKEFPLKDLYGVGFAWMEKTLFSIYSLLCNNY